MYIYMYIYGTLETAQARFRPWLDQVMDVGSKPESLRKASRIPIAREEGELHALPQGFRVTGILRL